MEADMAYLKALFYKLAQEKQQGSGFGEIPAPLPAAAWLLAVTAAPACRWN